ASPASAAPSAADQERCSRAVSRCPSAAYSSASARCAARRRAGRRRRTGPGPAGGCGSRACRRRRGARAGGDAGSGRAPGTRRFRARRARRVSTRSAPAGRVPAATSTASAAVRGSWPVRAGPATLGQGGRVGEGAGQRGASAQRRRGQVVDQGAQQGGVALALRDQLGGHGRLHGLPCRLREQGRGLLGRQRVQVDGGQRGQFPGQRTVGGGGEQEAATRLGQPLGRLPQEPPGGGRPPVGVVRAHQRRDPALAALHGVQQGPGGPLLVAGPGAGPRHQVAGAARAQDTRRPPQHGGAAEAGLPGHQQGGAVGGRLVPPGADTAQLRCAAVQPHRGEGGFLAGHPREVTRA
ncbi:hypothetical protein GA0115237_103326, partial [Streptomyces sp. ScaeMP-6W]